MCILYIINPDWLVTVKFTTQCFIDDHVMHYCLWTYLKIVCGETKFFSTLCFRIDFKPAAMREIVYSMVLVHLHQFKNNWNFHSEGGKRKDIPQRVFAAHSVLLLLLTWEKKLYLTCPGKTLTFLAFNRRPYSELLTFHSSLYSWATDG